MRLINDFEPEVKSLLETLAKHGCTPVRGDNGEDEFSVTEKFVENLCACDEARLYLKVPGTEKLGWVYLVLGNEPGVIASDYTVHPAIDAATEEHYNSWEGRKQPTREVA